LHEPQLKIDCIKKDDMELNSLAYEQEKWSLTISWQIFSSIPNGPLYSGDGFQFKTQDGEMRQTHIIVSGKDAGSEFRKLIQF